MKIYVTKYALTSGILEIDAEINDNMSVSRKGNSLAQYFHKPFWYLTKEEAIAHAEKLRENKILSVKKQLSKLEKMKF